MSLATSPPAEDLSGASSPKLLETESRKVSKPHYVIDLTEEADAPSSTSTTMSTVSVNDAKRVRTTPDDGNNNAGEEKTNVQSEPPKETPASTLPQPQSAEEPKATTLVAATSQPKRAKIRSLATVQKKVTVDLAAPELPGPGRTNAFNVSEVIKGFLFIGAGFDPSNRVVTHLPNDKAEPELRMERQSWFEQNNVRYALNMAGSPLQKELAGISYPIEDTLLEKLALDVNDLDEWFDAMVEPFEKGAEFIQKAFEEHSKIKSKPAPEAQPPRIFVHCVAGVNRSPFVVVWWLVKYHSIRPHDAWDIVRKRRDAGVNWTNQTLGGPVVQTLPNAGGEGPVAMPKKQKWFDELLRRFPNAQT